MAPIEKEGEEETTGEGGETTAAEPAPATGAPPAQEPADAEEAPAETDDGGGGAPG